jgi:hypothetical protein
MSESGKKSSKLVKNVNNKNNGENKNQAGGGTSTKPTSSPPTDANGSFTTNESYLRGIPSPYQQYMSPFHHAMVPPDPNTQILIELFGKLDSRLLNIEKGMSKLASIENSVTEMKCELNRINTENTSIKQKLDDVEISCQSMSDYCDEFQRFKKSMQTDLKTITSENGYLRRNLDNIKKSNSEMYDHVTEQRCNSFKNDLIFTGITETNPSQMENCIESINNFIRENIENDPDINVDKTVCCDNISLVKANRLGMFRGKPRPIHVTFQKFEDRENIRSKGIKLNARKGSFYVNEYYPPDIEQRRRKLFPVMRKYKGKSGYRVQLKNDKLTVNGQKYDIESGSWLNFSNNYQQTYDNEQRQNRTENIGQNNNRQTRFLQNNGNVTTRGQWFETPTHNTYEPLRQHEQQNKHKANSPLEDTLQKRFCENMEDEIISSNTHVAPQNIDRIESDQTCSDPYHNNNI